MTDRNSVKIARKADETGFRLSICLKGVEVSWIDFTPEELDGLVEVIKSQQEFRAQTKNFKLIEGGAGGENPPLAQ